MYKHGIQCQEVDENIFGVINIALLLQSSEYFENETRKVKKHAGLPYSSNIKIHKITK